MATKTAQIIIDVEYQSLTELNTEIKSLKKSMEGLKVGTNEWIAANQKLGKLQEQFKTATTEAKKLQGQVEQIASADKIRAVAKLGAGLVGSFSAASGALKLLGGQSERFDEMTAKATTLMQVMGGLNQVSELFSKGTLKGLGSLTSGFGTMLNSVKIASRGMKLALAATGIGLLIVAVGALVANWDKLKDAVTGASKAQKKANEANLKDAEKNVKLAEEQVKQLKNNISANSELLNQAQKTKILADVDLVSKKAALDLNKANLKILQQEADAVKANQYWSSKKYAAAKKAKTDLVEIAVAQQRTLETEIKLLEVETDRAEVAVAIADANQKSLDSLDKLQNQLVVINSELFTAEESYRKQQQILDEQIQGAWEKIFVSTAGTNKENLKLIDALEAQKTALKNQNDIRKAQLAIDIALTENELYRVDATILFNKELDRAYRIITDSNVALEDSQYILENNNALIALDFKGMEEGMKIRDEIVNFDLKRNDILNDRLKTLYPSELKLSKAVFAEIERFLKVYGKTVGYESIEFFANKVEELSEQNKINLQLQAGLNKEYEKRSRYGKQLVDEAAQELALRQIATDFTIKQLTTQKEEVDSQIVSENKLAGLAVKRQKALTKELEIIQDIAEANADAIFNAKNDEEKLVLLQKQAVVGNDMAQINADIAAAVEEEVVRLNEAERLRRESNALELEMLTTTESVGDAQREISAELENQVRLSTKLNDFLNKYNDEINASAQAINNSFTLVATSFGEQAKKKQQIIDKLNKAIDEASDKEEDLKNQRLDWEEELKDANGERYDELNRRINESIAKEAEQKTIQDTNAKAVEIQDKRRQEFLYKQARWEKANSIIQAVIQGALATVKALPNVFLAIATGVLSAAAIGTIVAQKVPPQETFEEGGFTAKASSNKKVAGVVHTNEYVAPAFVVNSVEGKQHIQALESQRLRGYTDGGFVAPDTSIGKEMIDYDRMAMAFYNAIATMPNPVVSVVKITNAQQEVQVTKQQAGLR